MIGTARRAGPACPRPAARDSLYTPVRVVELDLARPYELRSPDGRIQPDAGSDAGVLALVRLHGHPLGLVSSTGSAGGHAALCRALAAAAHRELAVPVPMVSAVRAPVGTAAATTTPSAAAPLISVVVATRDRPGQLRGCLDSLLRSDYPHFEVIVVDNAPSSEATRRLITARYPGRVRYLREPAAGLARAHNAALPAVRGELCAFTDDDTLADRRWLAALAEAFGQDPRVGCVTGLILAAELQTPSQLQLERLSGFAKGFAPLRWSLERPGPDPLFPFTAGKFGSGANMAFRTSTLRRLGGFDPATGTGTPARGGDDLLAFLRVLAAGHTLVYQPEALIWHHHRRNPEAVPAQAFGYGAGFGAFMAAAVVHEPRLATALLRRLPRGAALALQHAARHAATAPQTPGLGRLELRGLAYGPVGYLRSRRLARLIGD
ncbi:glycosyl transferase family 2 [Streptomyces tateyamensis]|uniref:Glycosyl transferase family 2 n=1 Tax=Streptomyces tateyamensis TaxID=565073 RepID=A0A2V4NUK6_9ACTN|nr:glycosyltransferase [Streptomyces tateyamensis]PYC84042.1 glycosyl transferase family 2 [Streptomyces tateyamensis]